MKKLHPHDQTNVSNLCAKLVSRGLIANQNTWEDVTSDKWRLAIY
jgi:hypothetical protein